MRLKYLFPILLFITGIALMLVQSLIQMNLEHKRMIKRSSAYAKIIGNRLASRITLEAKREGIVEQTLASLTAPYMADNLNQVAVYDQYYRLLFSRHISSYTNKKEILDSEFASRVIHDQFSHVLHNEEMNHVVGYFPIDLPVQQGEVLSRNVGIIHLVFDVSAEYNEAKEIALKSAGMNLATVFIMVSVFSSLMYFLVFRRLNALHKATQKLSNGDFDVYVESKREDELSQVVRTFNTMAKEMNIYRHTMEERIEQTLQERTEQTKLLIQQNRLASMGEMIGNIAHQWRQPLNALGLILQKMQILSQRGKLNEEKLKESVVKATFFIENMSKTIDDFRDFFRPDKQKEYFLLKETVFDVMKLLEAGFKESNIHVEVNIGEPECMIYGFKNEFSQVIINLLNNSRDALIEKQVTEGRILISAKQKKGAVIVKVVDNAGGIPEKIIDRVFEPYYTTKEEGKGTGIGLYMSKMIVEENMQGRMQVRNISNGAEFSMIFKNEKDKT